MPYGDDVCLSTSNLLEPIFINASQDNAPTGNIDSASSAALEIVFSSMFHQLSNPLLLDVEPIA